MYVDFLEQFTMTGSFPDKVLACMHEVFDRAGSWHTWRWRCTRYCLPEHRFATDDDQQKKGYDQGLQIPMLAKVNDGPDHKQAS